MSKQRLFALAILSLALLATSAFADDHHWGRGMNMNSNNADSQDCADHINIYSDGLPVTTRSEEVISLANQPLNVTASHNGGIHVRNWDKNEISVKLCRAAVARNKGDADRALSQIHLNNRGGRITVSEPENRNDEDVAWSSVVLILAPRGATLDLSVQNGGISLNQVSGNVTGHAINGGISMTQSSGNINVEAQNGGISIKDCGGDMRANVQNGGISIQLGETWNGAGLDARSHNGGLVVEIPKNFASSLEVSTSNHSSLVCQSSACENGQRTWDDNGRIFRLGGSNPVIHASTVNGGTIIKERGAGRHGDI